MLTTKERCNISRFLRNKNAEYLLL